MYLIAVCVILAIWYVISYLKWRKNVYIPIQKLPGDFPLPLIGTTYILFGIHREELFNFFIEYGKKFGCLFRTWSGSLPEIHVAKPEYLEIIMNNSIHITKGNQYVYLYPWLGEGLLTSTGAKWHQHRKLITPTFHFKILENFMDVFGEKTETLLENLDMKADGKPFNIYPNITHCALDIICDTAMGVTVNAMSTKNSNYITAIYDISEIIIWRMIRPYINNFIFNFLPKGRKFNENLKVLHGFSNRVIAERKELLKNQTNSQVNKGDDETLGRKKRMSFLDLLLEASEDGKVLSDKDIREEVDTFMFEGHDTTTAGMCWTLFLLGNHLEIQEKLYEEVHQVLQGKSVPTSLPELHDMKYLEYVIKEALRLYPSVPFIMRKLQQEVSIGGYKIPAGVEAVLHIYRVHRSSEYYPNPNQFDPDRFLPENSKARHPYAYIPFSAGPRNCIGQKFAMYEEKTILASIINRYKIISVEREENLKLTADLILRPLNGIFLKLERRK